MQHDYNIANQGFSSFRSDLNNALSAIQTTNSGTSRPTGAVAGQIWLDTTSATSPTLKFYDGADDISLATINYTANTVDWLDSSVTITGLSTTATGTVLTLTDTAHTTSVNMILGNNTALRFNELTANGSNYIGLKAPASLSADLTFTLPSTDGTSGQFLKTDGSGNLSFATAGLTGATSTATGTVLTLSDTQNVASVNVILDNEKALRFREATANGTNFVGLKAPSTLSADTTYTLPSADGTSGQVLQTNGSGVLSFVTGGGKFESALLHVRDEKASGTVSGAFTQGAWRTRTLNTVMTNEISGASLSANQIILPSGTYFITGYANTQVVNNHKAKLRNITDSTDTLIGTSEYSENTVTISNHSFVVGRFTISAQKTFELQHYCSATGNFGQQSGFGVVEVYGNVLIWKVA